MNCPKHVEFYSTNKFEKLVHLVGCIIRIYHYARSPERQISIVSGACRLYVLRILLCTKVLLSVVSFPGFLSMLTSKCLIKLSTACKVLLSFLFT